MPLLTSSQSTHIRREGKRGAILQMHGGVHVSVTELDGLFSKNMEGLAKGTHRQNPWCAQLRGGVCRSNAGLSMPEPFQQIMSKMVFLCGQSNGQHNQVMLAKMTSVSLLPTSGTVDSSPRITVLWCMKSKPTCRQCGYITRTSVLLSSLFPWML